MNSENKKPEQNQPHLMSHLRSDQSGDAMEVIEEAREEIKQPSFGAKLFMGQFDASMLYHFPEQKPEDKQIGDDYIAKLVKYLVETVDPLEVDKTHELPKHFIKGLAELGAFALKIPKKYGGMG